MFPSNQEEKTKLEDAIDRVLEHMEDESPDSDEYAKMADQVVKLYALKEVDVKKRVSPDTLAIIAGNLAGIVMIVGYERAHIVTSKAIGFLLKLR